MPNPHAAFLKRYQFCPQCQAAVDKMDNAIHCSNSQCDFVEYGNPAPSVCVAIIRDNQILLAKRAGEPEIGKWDAPGGFIDVGETAESTVTREIKEETGLEVKKVVYLASLPDIYGDRATINLAYYAEVEKGQPQAMDDVAELKWFSLDDLPPKEEIAFINTWQCAQLAKNYLETEKENRD